MRSIRLAEDTISHADIDALRDWLGSYPRLTQGDLVREYEQRFSDWLGIKHSIAVNSGSSANLLMLAALIESKRIQPGDSVVVPAISWSTDLAPVIQLGLRPILCDCNMKDLSVDIEHLLDIFKRKQPRALILVSVLGMCPDVIKIRRMCNRYDVLLLEDVCESMGARVNGMKLGTYGLMSSFSTFHGHIYSTVEGGFVCTNDQELAEILLCIRAHGWLRDLEEGRVKEYQKFHRINNFDNKFTFYYPGFNVRITEIQAFIGIRQLARIDEFLAQRRANYDIYKNLIGERMVLPPPKDCYILDAPFAIPLLVYPRQKYIDRLDAANVETRPIISGSMGEQPFYRSRYGMLRLPNAHEVSRNGLYLPNHHQLTEDDIQYICTALETK